ncbi:MAG TPA: nitrate- and nitrite sensing domain-containing protein [Streptosporangiaceae bacterium]|nr:nitrate- and nitrite sensing domain-containing protein [Streptosporangiaceae bacterium]
MSIAGSWQHAAADQRSETLANVSTQVTQLAFNVEAERDAIIWYIAAGNDGRAARLNHHKNPAALGLLQIVDQDFAYTDPWVKAVAHGVAGIGPSYPRPVQAVARAVAAKLRVLAGLRNLALRSQVSASDVLADYTNTVNTLLAFDDQIPLKSDDPQLTSTTRAMTTISRYENEVATQRAIVMYRLISGTMSPGMLAELTTSIADQKADNADFESFATPSQAVMFGKALAPSLDDRVISDEQVVVQDAQRNVVVPIVPQDWYGATSDVVAATHKYEETLAQSAVDRARGLRDRAITYAIVIGGILLLVLVLSLIFAMFIGRSMTDPPGRRITTAALSASS